MMLFCCFKRDTLLGIPSFKRFVEVAQSELSAYFAWAVVVSVGRNSKCTVFCCEVEGGAFYANPCLRYSVGRVITLEHAVSSLSCFSNMVKLAFSIMVKSYQDKNIIPLFFHGESESKGGGCYAG